MNTPAEDRKQASSAAAERTPSVEGMPAATFAPARSLDHPHRRALRVSGDSSEAIRIGAPNIGRIRRPGRARHGDGRIGRYDKCYGVGIAGRGVKRPGTTSGLEVTHGQAGR